MVGMVLSKWDMLKNSEKMFKTASKKKKTWIFSNLNMSTKDKYKITRLKITNWITAFPSFPVNLSVFCNRLTEYCSEITSASIWKQEKLKTCTTLTWEFFFNHVFDILGTYFCRGLSRRKIRGRTDNSQYSHHICSQEFYITGNTAYGVNSSILIINQSNTLKCKFKGGLRQETHPTPCIMVPIRYRAKVFLIAFSS